MSEASARGTLSARIRGFEFRNEALALLGLFLVMQFFPRRPGVGILVLGVSDAATLALHSVAIVLIFRANKFVNFAQLELAAIGGVLFTSLVQGQWLLNLARSTCGCIGREPGGLARNINFVFAFAAAVGITGLLAWLGYMTVLRRFRRSPRIMLTLVTIFAAQALQGTHQQIQDLLVPAADDNPELFQRIAERSTQPPGDFAWRVDPLATLRLGDILLILTALVTVIGLGVYIRRSKTGIAIRAAAESPARAQTLGVDVTAVTARVWLIAGLLAGLAGAVGSFGNAVQQSQGGDTATIPAGPLAMMLAVAVVARFKSLPMAGLAALAIGVLQPAVQFAYASTTPLDAALVFLIGGLLLVQRTRETRADREDVSGYEVTREMRPIPRELKELPQVLTWTRSAIVTLAVILLGLPWTLSASATTLATIYAIYSIIGLSLLILTGWAGQISLGQFGFAAIGAWAAASTPLPFPLALLFGGAVGAVASVVVGVPALKLRGLNLAISTLAFAVSARALFIDDRYFGKMARDSLERPSVLGMDFDDARVFWYFCVAVVIACSVAVIGLRRSRLGRVLIGLRANEAAGQSFGINPLRARLTAFAVAGFLAAFAGALFAYHQRELTPASFTADVSIEMFMYSVIGGLGGIAGPVLGFTYMGILSIFGSNPLIRYTGAGTGALLLLMASPGGLAQLLYDTRDAALRRLAVRLRIPVPALMGDRKAGQALDRAHLDERRGRHVQAEGSRSLLYKPDDQWALDRYGRVDATRNRVGQKEPVGG
jgi:branched-chain amino acid transport system permease protein